jgi:hypothetical protein
MVIFMLKVIPLNQINYYSWEQVATDFRISPLQSGRFPSENQCLVTTGAHTNTMNQRIQAAISGCDLHWLLASTGHIQVSRCLAQQHVSPDQTASAHENANPASVYSSMCILHITVDFLLLRIEIICIRTVRYISDPYCWGYDIMYIQYIHIVVWI